MKLTYVTAPLLLGLLCINFHSCKPKVSEAKVDKRAGNEVFNDDRDLMSEPEFPGGRQQWTEYITRQIETNLDKLEADKVNGTVMVSFTVDTTGEVQNARAESCCESDVKNCASPNSKLAEVAVEAIRNGPKWKPAIRVSDGKAVKTTKRQPITFRIVREEI